MLSHYQLTINFIGHHNQLHHFFILAFTFRRVLYAVQGAIRTLIIRLQIDNWCRFQSTFLKL